jgi:hypothetical protein
MPDLTIEIYDMCTTMNYKQYEIEGSTGNTYTVVRDRNRWTCGCKGFRFRGSCRHIREAQSRACSWHGQYCEGAAINGKCPRCGGDVMPVRCGV